MTKLSIILALVGAIGIANAECPNACSGHGECGVFDQCSCYRNWQSNDCSQRTCPFGHAHVDTPKGDLNMNGGALSGPEDPVIINSEVYPLGTTEQYPDAQDNEAHFYMECSNKGLCDRKNGLCKCFDGYDGASCQRASCPGGVAGDSDQCSGRGTCHSIDYLAHYHGESQFPLDYSSTVSYKLWDAGYTRGCLCDPRFTGANCAARQCKFGVDPLYVSTGTALYQKAFVVNSCQASELVDDDKVPSPGITTNGNHHVYEDVAYTATAGVLDTLAVYDGFITISADAVPAWAVAGAEIIATEDEAAPTTFGDDEAISTIGCRYTVVDAEVDTATTVRLYVKATGETSNADLIKCGPVGIGKMEADAEYTVYHVTNTFTLLFTDHFGAVYRTVPISAAVADYSDEIKAALEGLPNRVVEEVVVRGVMVNPFDTVDDVNGAVAASPAEMAYEIEFISNPGQLNALKIDSTPIRLGQTLQAGIECEFNQATLSHESIVYSSVGYSEIGEDSTNFAEYIGNVGYFTHQQYLVDANNVIVSGKENQFIYTATDLTSVLAADDVIKIKNEIYVVNAIAESYIKLNTWFNGDAVQGISTQLKYNDMTGNDVGDGVFTLKFDANKLIVFEAEFNTPSFNSDESRRYDDRKGDFADGKYIRIESEGGTHTFDCIFLLTDDTVAAYVGAVADATDLNSVPATRLYPKWTYRLTVLNNANNCPTLLNSLAANTGGISVKMYQWEPTGYTNGRYAEKTRIFKKSGNKAKPVTDDQTPVFLVIQRGSNKAVAAGTIADCEAGTKVLYGNEINVIDSCDADDIYFKNAVAWETSFFAADRASLVGYDFDNLYILPDDFGERDAKDYTYVSQCSNRGVCDGASGLCKCFKGYTGDSCNTISELFG